MTARRSFGGDAGTILWGSLHPSGFFTGATVGGVVFGAGWMLAQGGGLRALPIAVQVLLSVALVRIALNSAFTRPEGGIFTPGGCSLSESAGAVGRLVLLNLLWSLPLALASDVGEWRGAAGGPPSTAAAAVPLVVLLLPPLFLIAAVAARGMGDLLDPSFWRALLGGRASDVVTLYGVFLGGAGLAAGGATLAGFLLGAGHARWTFFLLLVAASYGAGVALLLLGRLIGGFVRSADAEAPVAGTPSPLRGHPLGDPVGRSAPPDLEVELDELPPDVDAQASTTEPTAAWEAVLEEPLPAAGRTPADRIGEPTQQRPRTERLRANARRAEEDPDGALEEVEGWIASEGPHPLFLIRRSSLRLQHEDDDAGLAEALAAARRTGAVGALADLYLAAPERLDAEGLELGERLRMADALLAQRRGADAACLYLRELADDPRALPAVKGVIGIADQALERGSDAELALGLLDDLDAAAPEHGFDDFVTRLREEAERRLARTP